MTPHNLQDAALRIAAYGSRAGLFADDDTTLFEAIEEAERARPLTWDMPEATKLRVAVNRATKSILPVTLCDLTSGWDPFATPPHKDNGRLIRPASTFFAVMLIVICGYYTLWHQRATELLNFLETDIIEEQASIVDDMFLPLLASLGPDQPDDPIQLAAFLKSAGRVKKLEQSIESFRLNFDTLYQDRVIGVGQAKALLALLPERASRPPIGSAQAAEPPSEREKRQIFQLLGLADCEVRPAERFATQFVSDAQDKAVVGAVARLDRLSHLRDCFLDALGVTPMKRDMLRAQQSKLYSLQHSVNVVGLWLLPALYGALGAIIYYMRYFLNRLRPDPRLSRVVMRVALGAFAGIAVAWFWTPSFSQAVSAPNVSLGTLTFAFMLGFSIELFFGLLDRLVHLAMGAVNRLGA
jgi:hypothetical protein